VKTVLYFPANDFKLILAFRNPPTADKIGFELGLFIRGLKVVHFHNPFVKKHLRSFLESAYGGQDWVCFFGPEGGFIFIILL